MCFLLGSAYAPDGMPAERVRVSLRVGADAQAVRRGRQPRLEIATCSGRRRRARAFCSHADFLRRGLRRRGQSDPGSQQDMKRIFRTRSEGDSIRRAKASRLTASRCRTPRNRATRSSSPREPTIRWVSAPSVAPGSRAPVRGHLRPELDRQRFPVPAGRFRRALLPERAARPADRLPAGRRGGHAAQPHATRSNRI